MIKRKEMMEVTVNWLRLAIDINQFRKLDIAAKFAHSLIWVDIVWQSDINDSRKSWFHLIMGVIKRCPAIPGRCLAADHLQQIADTSTRTSFGSLETSTVSRAGRISPK